MTFTLEALQGNDGDCLLLHYTPSGGAPTLILIDGGSRGVYTKVLRPRLDELRGQGVLDLRMVMVSHIDADHITGIVDLFRDMRELESDGQPAFCRVKTLWHNAFAQLGGGQPASVESAVVAASLGGAAPAGLTEQTAAVIASVQQGSDLRNYATQLHVPLNESAVDPLVKTPAQSLRVVKIAEGLTFTILAPSQEQLDALDEDWQKAKIKPTPEAQAADYLNRTVPNLSSIVVLAEASEGGKTRRMLLTGDAGGDHILATLKARGLLKNNWFHVDLLKVQHHGSNHSVDQGFFEQVTADHYVISGNGKHGIPHEETLQWLSDARPNGHYIVYMTNRVGVLDLETRLDAFLARDAHRPNHVYRFRAEADKSISVAL